MRKNKLMTAVLTTATLFASIGLATSLSTNPTFAKITSVSTTVEQTGKPSLAPMIKEVLPSVVAINVKAVEKVSGSQDDAESFIQLLPKEFQDLLGNGFSNRQSQTRNVSYQGSGVIIDAENGYVVTNNHVVKGGKVISVKLADNRSFSAHIVGTDPDTDLAILKLDSFSDLKQLSFADSSKTQIGDYVVAIGNPFGIGLTATSGIVSATNRSANLNVYDNFIQTDASINRGNSGGALVDLNGNLVGINSAILSHSGDSVGIGFAIPGNIVKSISEQIIENGHVSRGQIGIRGNNLNAQIVEQLGLTVSSGAFVSQVIPDSPAEKAGLKAGDVVTSFNGSKVVDFNQLRALVGSLPANSTFELGLVRGGKHLTLSVTSEPRNGGGHLSAKGDAKHNNTTTLTYRGTVFIDQNGKVVVDSTNQKSIFAMYGIRKGDVIVSFGGKAVDSVSQLQSLIEQNESDVIAVGFMRGNTKIFVTLTNE